MGRLTIKGPKVAHQFALLRSVEGSLISENRLSIASGGVASKGFPASAMIF